MSLCTLIFVIKATEALYVKKKHLTIKTDGELSQENEELRSHPQAWLKIGKRGCL